MPIITTTRRKRRSIKPFQQREIMKPTGPSVFGPRSNKRTLSSFLILFIGVMLSIAAVDIWSRRRLSTSSDQQAFRTSVSTNQHQKSFEPWSTGLAAKQSFGFFDDIGDTAWSRMRNNAVNFQQYRKPQKPDTGNEDPWRWYINNLEPDFSCPHAARVGGHGDGPKWVCDPHRLQTKDDCLIYSIGSSGNYLFEDSLLGLAGKGQCEIHVFDFGDFDRPENADNRIFYHPWGLGSSYDDVYSDRIKKIAGEQEVLTFQEILRRLNHENRTIDLFKIDCEGCEWSSYKDWIDKDLRQIQIEVHGLPSARSGISGSDFYNSFRNNSFAMFSKEHNQFTKSCYELSYIKLSKDFWETN
jgi:hypothetical protein